MINENSELNKVKKVCLTENNGDIIESRLCIIEHECRAGFEIMKKYPKSVTFFGSARLPEENPYVQKAEKLAYKVAQAGYAVVTGGGPGIMQGASKGAFEGKGASIGLNIELPFEQELNPYVTESVDFHHFFPRKVALAYSAEAYIYFPGGFGTLDELFEVLTLKQTKKIPQTPIILFGTEFWKPLENFFKEVFLGENQTIAKEDLNLYTITDDMDEVIKIITSAPIRTEVSERFQK